jgi:acetyltransferase-like isoleucine patch superfamily enzyme
MKVGKYTYGVENIRLFWGTSDLVVVGSFCSIAGNLTIYLGGNHRKDWVTTFPFGHIHQNVFNTFDGKGHPSTNGGVVIGHDVWIADNVTIMSGVKIGSGSIIASNSHVVKDVEPYSIVGGNPAKLIKYRFDKSQIEELIKISWWTWDDDKIKENVPLLCQSNIELFIEKHK